MKIGKKKFYKIDHKMREKGPARITQCHLFKPYRWRSKPKRVDQNKFSPAGFYKIRQGILLKWTWFSTVDILVLISLDWHSWCFAYIIYFCPRLVTLVWRSNVLSHPLWLVFPESGIPVVYKRQLWYQMVEINFVNERDEMVWNEIETEILIS